MLKLILTLKIALGKPQFYYTMHRKYHKKTSILNVDLIRHKLLKFEPVPVEMTVCKTREIINP